ncbi:MAG: hypothetical protein H7230_04180 [Candidatus Parcubacteria bacterium]|nr:hypothetical protein [Candidatus Paceibacterota bacterium]
MSTIILNATTDQVIYQLCLRSEQDFIQTYLPFAQVGNSSLSYNKNQLLDWNRYKLASLSDLEATLNSETSDLFSDDLGNSNLKLLIDYQDLELNSEAIAMLERTESTDLVLYSLNHDTSTTINKLLKGTNIQVIDYQQIPKDKVTKEAYLQSLSQLATDYAQRLELSLNPSQLKQVASSAATYREIIDHLDFLSLTDKPAQYINQLIIEDKPILFMQAFGTRMSQSTIDIWKNIPEGEMQLSLSLAYTKLLKAGEKNLIKDLIDTDFKVKTSTKLTPLTRWKYFLWQVAN